MSVEVGFELSRFTDKEALAASGFHTGDALRYLVTMGIAKRPYTFYYRPDSRLPAITDYQED
jgi:hypothetical protein